MKPTISHSLALLRWILIAGLLCTALFTSANINDDTMEQVMQAHYGATGINQLHAWQKLLDDNSHQNHTELEQVKQINDFFNVHIRFEDDIVHWHQRDYWATPLETLGSGAGDCEDYTIAKYVSLLRIGIPPERLRLIYVKAQIGGPSSRVFQAHMVLGYYPRLNATPLILDSLVANIEPADQRSDLHPVFSFNSDGLWVGGQAQPQIDPTARLSRWRDVLMRMKQEGF